ncbi:hypothetical protein F7230_06585 [Corynebacterium sp. 320]|nr:hypothetical protein F7230_06585 [Corynebacterium sp. 320]KAB1550590.1 hypothetical protein F7233_08600 [Corynebacterium sp. 321]KAB1550951.1 hypothetical protein F7232_07780 [Corynebacterium sp. 319]KAB3526994.1 hypothetical protein F8354_06585 [Corynebacterium sp. 250]KAB3538486.1 hypothetical protein F8390_09485 [Corynebacterium sp. 366]QNP92393.1 hypothetical protein IAU67_00730 [Corynebacterium zhongnanshanii]
MKGMSIQDNFTYITDLRGEHSHSEGEGRAVPTVKKVADLDGARIIRLTFRAGDVMADHQAPAPIVVLGQEGSIEFTVGASSTEAPNSSQQDPDSSHTVTLSQGSAIHVAAGQVHSLRAQEPAQATLILFTGSQPVEFLPHPPK